MGDATSGAPSGITEAWRFVLNVPKGCAEEHVCVVPGKAADLDFPVVPPQLLGRQSRFGYCAGYAAGGEGHAHCWWCVAFHHGIAAK